MKSVPMFDNGEKTGEGSDVLPLVRHLDLDFRERIQRPPAESRWSLNQSFPRETLEIFAYRCFDIYSW